MLKENGCIALIVNDTLADSLVKKYLNWFKHEWILMNSTTNIFSNAKRKSPQVQEKILIFSKGSELKSIKQKEYTNNVIHTNSEMRLGTTQKSLSIFESIIKTYTNENDLIVDCCAGAGEIVIACKNTNRRFIANDNDFGFYEKIKEKATL